MERKAKNKLLHKAKKAKCDEFYTQYCDIQKEIDKYIEYNPDVFRGRVVYCNCDDPRISNFFKYFFINFSKFGLKKLISSCYKKKNNEMCDTEKAFYIECDSDEFDLNRIDKKIKYFKNDGDFRSIESTELLMQSDIVITNPPFSLFREYIKQLVDYDKDFLIIANINAITYKEVFPLIKENKIWLGTGMGRWISGFIVPESYDLYGSEARIDDEGTRIVATNNCLWFTNLDHGKRHQQLPLMTMSDNIKFSFHKEIKGKEYKKYDNYDAIEIPYSDAIPNDYNGVMGVPITFLDKYNPDQFEIIGASDNGAVDEKYKLAHFKKHNEPYINGNKTYKRIFIKKYIN